MNQQQKSTQIKLLLVLLLLPHFGFTQSNIPQYNFTFEDTTHEYFMYRDTLSNPNCIWQVGEPQKTVFTTSVSLPNAIVTDTINSYPINDTSSFIIKHEVGDGFLKYGGTPGIHLSADYFVNTDTLNDYGKIEFSPDNGNSWILISDDTLDGEFGTTWPIISDCSLTGNSYNWKSFFIDMSAYNYTLFNVGDSVQYRFTFISDGNSENLDGLMFDNITILDVSFGGTEEFTKSSNNSYPNPFSNQLTFKVNNETTNLIIYDINGKTVYTTQFKNQSLIEINTSQFESGMYFYELLDPNGDKLENGKIVKH
jgi:hypothetical protein